MDMKEVSRLHVNKDGQQLQPDHEIGTPIKQTPVDSRHQRLKCCSLYHLAAGVVVLASVAPPAIGLGPT